MRAHNPNVVINHETTKCVVLFDDNPNNITNIKNYNARTGNKFIALLAKDG